MTHGSRQSGLRKVPIREPEVLFPVESGNVVNAAADMVPDGVADWLVNLGHGADIQAGAIQEAIHRVGMKCREEFAMRIGPTIFLGAGHVERAGRNEGEQHVLIHGQLGFASIVLFERAAEPMWK